MAIKIQEWLRKKYICNIKKIHSLHRLLLEVIIRALLKFDSLNCSRSLGSRGSISLKLSTVSPLRREVRSWYQQKCFLVCKIYMRHVTEVMSLSINILVNVYNLHLWCRFQLNTTRGTLDFRGCALPHPSNPT